MAQCRIWTLGTFRITADDVDVTPPSTQKARALLVFLALQRDRDIARERIVDVFWPEFSPENARANLNTALYSIRRAFRQAGLADDDFLAATKSSVRWVAPTHVDVDALERLAAGDAQPANARELTHLGGEFLEEFYDEWSVSRREYYSSLFERVLSRSLDANPDADAARELIARNPYDERAYVVLIDADVAANRHIAAADLLRKFRASLDELGEKPSAQFEARYAALERWKTGRPPELHLAFSGRFAELAQLQDAIVDASARAHGGVFLVSGEPGIGKTSLLSRASEMARATGMRVVDAKAIAGDPRPLGPWASAFGDVVGRKADTLVPGAGETYADALCTTFVNALHAPALLCIDDAQWLEADAVGLSLRIAALATQAGHLVIFGARPEGLRSLSPLFDTARARSIRLRPLTKNDVESSFRDAGLVSDSSFVEAVFNRTGGQPLYLEHVLDSLVSGGAIRRGRNRWHVGQEVDLEHALPASLAAVLESRLRSAGAGAVEVAGALALEPAATVDDLVAVLDVGESAILDGLDDLLALEVLVQPPQGAPFAFAHDLLREVAAATVNRPRAASLHRAFAAVLAQRAGPDMSYRRATHLAAGGADLEAADAFAMAALEAFRWQAFVAARERCGTGLRLAERLEREPAVHRALANLYQTQGRIFAHVGDFDPALVATTRSVEHARQTGDDTLLCRRLINLSGIDNYVEHHADGLRDARASLAIAERLGDERLQSQAHYYVAASHMLMGGSAAALEHARACAELARRSDDQWGQVGATTVLLLVQVISRRFDGLQEAAARLIELSAPMGNMTLSTAILYRAWLHHAVDDARSMDASLTEAETLFEESASGRTRDDNQGIATETLRFEIAYSRTLLDMHLGNAEAVLEREPLLTRMAEALRRPHIQNIAKMATIDALLARGADGDAERAESLAKSLSEIERAPSPEGWSDCWQLARARTAARLRRADAPALIAQAREALERQAATSPLVVDRSFLLLARASADVGLVESASALSARAQASRAERRAAAGPLWRGD